MMLAIQLAGIAALLALPMLLILITPEDN